ncbi:hypothetical protein [Rhodospira trueperi]|nr:hypothetical protein [Rhodospira trueperi]
MVFFYKRTMIVSMVLFSLVILAVLMAASPRLFVGHFRVLVQAPDVDTSRILPDTGVFMNQPFMNAEFLANEMEVLVSDTVLDNVLTELEARHPDFSTNFVDYMPAWVRAFKDQAAAITGQIKDFITGIFPFPVGTPKEIDELNVWRAKMQGLRGLIVAAPLEGTHIIEVKVSFFDRSKLVEIQRLLVDAYLNDRARIFGSENAVSVYAADAAAQRATYDALMDEITRFRRARDLADVDTLRSEFTAGIEAHSEAIRNLEGELEEAKLQMRSATTGPNILAIGQEISQANPITAMLSDEIVAKEAEIAQLPPGSPRRRSLETVLQSLYERYQDAKVGYFTGRMEALTERIALHREAAQSLKQGLIEMTTDQQTLDTMEQDADLVRESYLAFSRKAQEIRVQNILREHSTNTISVIREPFTDDDPVWPQLIILLPLFVIVSGFLGTLLAYVSYSFEDIVLQPSELKLVDVPCLGCVPKYS